MADYHKSFLYDYHVESGAKFSPAFAWSLVQNYADGVITEQQYAEKHAIIFDNSHLSKFRITYDKSCEKEFDKFFSTPISSQNDFCYAENFLLNNNSQVLDSVKTIKMADCDIFLIASCEKKKILDNFFNELSKNKKIKNFNCFDLTYDLGGIYLYGKEAKAVLDKVGADMDFFAKPNNANIITIRDYRYIATVIDNNEESFACQFFGSEESIEDLWIELYNIDPIKPIGVTAAENLALDKENRQFFATQNADKLQGIILLPSRRPANCGMLIYDEADETIVIGKVLKSYFSSKHDCCATYAEFEQNYAKNKKIVLKDENICIKAEIIKIFDLT